MPIGKFSLNLSVLNKDNNIVFSSNRTLSVKNGNMVINLERSYRAGKAGLFSGEKCHLDAYLANKNIKVVNGFTFEAWVNPESRYYNTIISENHANFFIQLVQSLRPGFYFKNISMDYSGAEYYWERLLLKQSVPEKKWTHIACSYDAKKQLFTTYINGIIKYQCKAIGTPEIFKDHIRIGGRISKRYKEYFKGLIDEVRVWNVVRTQDQIFSNMKKELTGKEKGLIGYWDFNGLAKNNEIKDKSHNRLNAVASGDFKLVNSTAF